MDRDLSDIVNLELELVQTGIETALMHNNSRIYIRSFPAPSGEILTFDPFGDINIYFNKRSVHSKEYDLIITARNEIKDIAKNYTETFISHLVSEKFIDITLRIFSFPFGRALEKRIIAKNILNRCVFSTASFDEIALNESLRSIAVAMGRA